MARLNLLRRYKDRHKWEHCWHKDYIDIMNGDGINLRSLEKLLRNIYRTTLNAVWDIVVISSKDMHVIFGVLFFRFYDLMEDK